MFFSTSKAQGSRESNNCAVSRSIYLLFTGDFFMVTGILPGWAFF